MSKKGLEQYSLDAEVSASEDDEEERFLKQKLQGNRRTVDKNVELMAFDESADEEDSVIGSDHSDIPDAKAWGKKRGSYYHTDFVDEDYSTYNEKDEETALQEEEEAKAIQQRLANQLNDADFSLDILLDSSTAEKTKQEQSVDKLKSDISNLSTRQKKNLFLKDSPEFAGLISDFKENLQQSEHLLAPIITYAKENDLQIPAVEFAKIKNNLILTYCANISFYLLLKAKRLPIKHHPVIARVIQLKRLLQQLDKKYAVIETHLETLLDALKSDAENIRTESNIKSMANLNGDLEKRKLQVNLTDNMEDIDEMDLEDDVEGDDDGRRAATYQIVKNKGLTPHRKKELRNPRVKHRNKYRKALIRRKGAVRTTRKEIKRYDGEISGIKSTVKKGIKIK